jgi:hypothetical protein
MGDGLSVATANAAAATITGTNAAWVQLHTGAPGAAGTSNVSSTTTRQSVTWAAASGGAVAASNQPAWTGWAGNNGETDTDITLWSLAAGGTFGLSMQLSSPVVMNIGDSLTLTSITVTLPTAS